MKRCMILAVLCCFLLVGCSKPAESTKTTDGKAKDTTKTPEHTAKKPINPMENGGAVKQAAKTPAAEAAQPPAAKEPAKEAAKEPAKEPSKEPAKEADKAPAGKDG